MALRVTRMDSKTTVKGASEEGALLSSYNALINILSVGFIIGRPIAGKIRLLNYRGYIEKESRPVAVKNLRSAIKVFSKYSNKTPYDLIKIFATKNNFDETSLIDMYEERLCIMIAEGAKDKRESQQKALSATFCHFCECIDPLRFFEV